MLRLVMAFPELLRFTAHLTFPFFLLLSQKYAEMSCQHFKGNRVRANVISGVGIFIPRLFFSQIS